MTTTARWTEDETKRALYLYFQLPFGQLHRKNPEIMALAASIDRTASSVAMKLANFASLDPKIVESGRKGLAGASALDRRVWDEFNKDWTRLIVETATRDSLPSPDVSPSPDESKVRQTPFDFRYEPPEGITTTRAEVERRIGQNFFRRAVMANFSNSCCVTGIDEPRLLVASHISPWNEDIPNRHNPRNGLCLSATFDMAFDKFLMTVTPDLTIRVSGRLIKSETPETRAYFTRYEGTKLRTPTHLMPDENLLAAHNERFLS